jgi:NTP pyrophosphatase (non-canonical NTP hydrolase)
MTDRTTQLLQTIKQFVADRNWEQFHEPKNLAISLNLEAAEVLELFQWTKDNFLEADKHEHLAEELADVFYWLILLSNKFDIDLFDALEKKMKQNEKKYPIEKAKGTSKKYTQL